ncbi:hypothetical protein AGLY_001921 [Aphis glycines]|uniref:Uncharacterized protein n=1 Tax=Aphis glycines TaxID=307491 RepID=A0A6G0U4S4_APHGL|nr:hypothetical protein AGLY_001921 [Aphis glycines]
MPTKYYSVYSHRYMISRNFTRKYKRKDTLGLLPVVRDLRNGAGDSISDHGNNRTRKDDSLCDILSSPSFRFVICLIIVMVVLLYKSVYMDYFHLKNEKSSISIMKTSWNSTRIVMSFNRTAGGRGINVAVIESTTYTIMDVKNFDTYEYNSSNLDEWLDHMVKVGDVGVGKFKIYGTDVNVTGNPIVSDDLSNQQLSFCNNTFDDYTMHCNESSEHTGSVNYGYSRSESREIHQTTTSRLLDRTE